MLALLLTLMLHPNADSLKVFRAPDVVVTSTRTRIPPQSSPTKVTDLNVNQLSGLGFTDLQSILSFADGLFVKDYGPSQLSTISLRGTGAEQTLFMIDGIRMNSVQNGVVDLFLIPVSEIGNIEIAEGGSSALYGADAVGGVINMNTATHLSPHISLHFSGGSYGYQKSRASINERAGNASINVMIERARAKDDYKFDFGDGRNSFPMRRTGADFVTDNEFVKVTLPDSQSSTFIVLSNTSANRGTPGPVTGPFYVGTQREYDNDFFSVIKHRRRLGDFLLSASAGFTYDYLRYIDPPTVAGGYSIDDFYKMVSLQPSLRVNYTSGPFEGTAGIDGEEDHGTSSEMAGEKRRTRGGVFISSVLNLHGPYDSELHISPSARLDWYSDFGSSFNPRIGINIRPVESLPINVRASVGTSFRAPTFNELYYASAGNPYIKPEHSVNYDGGVVLTVRRPLYLETSADLYSINITDGIVWQPSTGSLWRPVNYARTLSRGIELSVQANYREIAALRAAYTFGQSLDMSNPGSPTYDKQLIYLPQEKASVVAAVSPWITTFTAALQYVSFRYITAANDEFIPGFTTVNLSAGAKIPLERFILSPSFSVRNLFNAPYQVLPEYPMPLRTFYFSLGVKFNQ